MPRFFTDRIYENTAEITGSDARHIGRSLRMRVGEEIVLSKDGMDYLCRLSSISDERAVCEILSAEPSRAEPTLRLTLFQAVPKQDKLETIIQKATELGIYEVIPVITSRCISRPDKKGFAAKRERLQRIALEAAKQSGRAVIPTVGELIDFREMTERLGGFERSFFCYEKGGERFSPESLSGIRTAALIIGSEGGFSAEEAAAASAAGALTIGMGERILRCETAPLSAISIIMYISGNM